MPNLSVWIAAAIGAAVSQPLLRVARGIVSRLEAQWREDLRLTLQEVGSPVPVPIANISGHDHRFVPQRANVVAALACTVGYAVCVWRFGVSIPLALALLNISTLFVLSATDAESLLLPDVLTIPLMWVGLLANVKGQFASTSSAIIGACAGYTSMWLLRRMSMILTSRERVGLGDAKLVAAAGAWLGWDALPEVALIALLSYLVYETWRKIWGKPASPLRPLGPHIALGFAYALCAGPHLLPIRFPL